MSTRAVYTFKDKRGTFHVYGHRGGYPEEAIKIIKETISANKIPIPGSELTPHYDSHIDLEYRYTITFKKGSFVISAFERVSGFFDKPKYFLIFRGSLDEFTEKE